MTQKNNASSLYLFVSIGLFIFCGTSCAYKYKSIDTLNLEYSNAPKKLDSSNVEITYQYNILKKSKNRKYAKMEKLEGVSLIAILIDNPGVDTLYFSEDILIYSENELLNPLDLRDANMLLAQPHPREGETLDDQSFLGEFVFNFIPNIVNTIKLKKANLRFWNEMDENYLVDSIILPGATVSGVVALPVLLNEPLTFYLKK
jgi:hypothetical protein